MAAASAAVLVLSMATPGAAAGDTIDQSQLLTLSFQRQIPLLAQTFTAGTTAAIDRVSLASDTPTGFASVRVSIETVASSGAPSGDVLGTPSSFAGSFQCCKRFHDFAFDPAVSVTAGTRYAIVVQTLVGVFTWHNSSSVDNYAGGQLYVSCVGCAWSTGVSFGDDFAFETWVTTAVNGPPTVASDRSSVTSNEGTAPSNTGTYSDPDSDTVTLTASAGSVTRTSGTGAGTWSWTQPASDELPAQTITVTASDGHGHTATTSFTVTVTAVAPSARIVTDPVTIPEGTAVPFTGAATSPDVDDSRAGFAYGWRVTKNGGSYATGTGVSFAFTPDDEGTYVVTFQATDDGGMAGTDSMTMLGTNVAPTAHIAGFTASAPVVRTAWETLTFDGSFSDAGVLDTHTVRWSFGDGATSTASYGAGGSANVSATHAYASAGAYTVTLTVTDDDGGVSSASTQVTVQTVAQALDSIAAYVQALPGLNAGQKHSLIADLDAASASTARGNNRAAGNELNAFLNELQADVTTQKVAIGNASALRLAVHAVQTALGTYNRFLEWWPVEA